MEARRQGISLAEFLRRAPHTLAIRRPDEVRAAKEPVLRWKP